MIVKWTLEGCLKSVLVDKMKAGSMFTAFDITQAARATSPNQSIGHNGVKDFVHASYPAMATVGYERTSILLRNGERAFVYHPEGADPNTYQIPIAALPAPAIVDDEDVIEGEVVEDDDFAAKMKVI